jgi:antitoxin (DNA-binding transcriptional repressor) of toxin-antitoxin stability system
MRPARPASPKTLLERILASIADGRCCREFCAIWARRRLVNLDTYGHHEAMKRAMVSELKAHLSAYLAEVRRGRSILICDRANPVARLVPFVQDETDGFDVVPATRPASDVRRVRGIRPRAPIDVVRVLRDDRDAR